MLYSLFDNRINANLTSNGKKENAFILFEILLYGLELRENNAINRIGASAKLFY